jgi:hypothetical protein
MYILTFDVLLYCLRWILGLRVNPNSNLLLKKKQTESCTVSDSANFGLVALGRLSLGQCPGQVDKNQDP